jgi:hypothetical protein
MSKACRGNNPSANIPFAASCFMKGVCCISVAIFGVAVNQANITKRRHKQLLNDPYLVSSRD